MSDFALTKELALASGFLKINFFFFYATAEYRRKERSRAQIFLAKIYCQCLRETRMNSLIVTPGLATPAQLVDYAHNS